jgi:hypothetical protein
LRGKKKREKKGKSKVNGIDVSLQNSKQKLLWESVGQSAKGLLTYTTQDVQWDIVLYLKSILWVLHKKKIIHVSKPKLIACKQHLQLFDLLL